MVEDNFLSCRDIKFSEIIDFILREEAVTYINLILTFFLKNEFLIRKFKIPHGS